MDDDGRNASKTAEYVLHDIILNSKRQACNKYAVLGSLADMLFDKQVRDER
jgi:hypothetical protein